MATFTPMGIQATVKGIETYVRDVGRMESTNASFASNTNAVASQMSGLTGISGKLQSALGSLTVAGFLYMARGAAEAAFELATLGAETIRIQEAIDRVAKAAGQSGSAIADAMDSATGHILDDEALVQAATRGMVMGLNLTAKEWGQLAKGAQYHARIIGESAESVFSTMVEAIARGQPRMLSGLMFAGAKDAIEQASNALEGTGASMSEAERQATLLKLAMELLNQEMLKYGPAASDLITQTQALSRAWSDFKEQLGIKLVPILQPLVEGALVAINFREEITKGADAGNWLAKALLAIHPELRALNRELVDYASLGREFVSVTKDMVKSLPNKNDLAGWRAYIEGVNRQFSVMYRLPVKATVKQMDELRDKLQGGDLQVAIGQAMVETHEALYPTAKDYEQMAKDAARAMEDAAKESARAWEEAYDDLRSNVEAALQETDVTIQDIAASASGTYIDKWDESRRRLQAIVERGFSELQAHADWASVLEIPESVLKGSEQQLRDWAQGAIAAGPGRWGNIEAALAVVEQYIAQKEATQAFYEQVTQAYAAKHGIKIGAATKAVTGALGGEAAQAKSAVAALPEELTRTATAIAPQVITAAQPIGDAILKGIEQGMDKGWPGFVTRLTEKITALVQGILNLLDAHSPSQVFVDVGKTMVTGLEKGVSALPLMLPARTGGRGATVIGGDTNIQNINDPATLYLAMAIQQDRKRSRWNAAMGVT